MKIKNCAIFVITIILMTNKSFGQFVLTPASTNLNPLTTDGNVGIGTGIGSQAAKLHILSTTNQLRLANGPFFSDINTTAIGHLVFQPNSTSGKIAFGIAAPASGIGFHSNMGSLMVTDPTSAIRGFQVIPSRSANGDVPSGTTILSSMTTIGEGLSIATCGSGANGVKLGAYAYNPSAGGWKSMWETANTNGIGQIPNLILVKNGGNVGIGTGTTTPDKLLTVKSTAANTQIAKFADNARYIGLGRDEVAAFDLAGNPANLYLGGSKLTILTTGNIGVGTTTPDKLLTIKSTVANTQIAKFADDTKYIGLGRDEVAAFDLTGNPTNLYLGSNNSFTFLRGNVGIGTNNPSEHFQVGDRFVFHDGGSKYLGYNIHYDGTGNVRLVNDYSSMIGFGGGHINFQTDDVGIPGSVVNATTKLIIKNTGEIGIGTTTPNKKLTVIGDASIVSSAVNAFEILDASSTVNFRVKNTGVVYAREINVQLTAFPDYVFKKDYVLTPLSEVEKYIIKNNHLKGFEPANEYECNGMAVGEVVRLQQEKIEELTLYLIEQQKQLGELKKQMDSLKK